MSKEELINILYELPDDCEVYFDLSCGKSISFLPIDELEIVDINYDNGNKVPAILLQTLATIPNNEGFIYNLVCN